nr:unnamed protein product [Callosobruchus analis]
MLASSSDSNVSDSSSEDDISEDELLPEGDQYTIESFERETSKVIEDALAALQSAQENNEIRRDNEHTGEICNQNHVIISQTPQKDNNRRGKKKAEIPVQQSISINLKKERKMDLYIRDVGEPDICTKSISTAVEFLDVQKSSSDKKFIILHKIRSIFKNFEEMNLLLEEMDYFFDIIIFTETRVIEDMSLFRIKGYNVIYNEGMLNQNDGTVR